MKKSELLKLIENVADDGEINDLLLSNEEFKTKEIDVDSFKELLASNKEIKAYYQSALDSGISKGVAKFEENFKANKLPGLIEEGIKAKSDEGLTEEQKKLRELQATLEAMKKEKEDGERLSKYRNSEEGKNIPEKLLSKLISNDETLTAELIGLYNTSIKELVEVQVKERLNGGAYKPPLGGESIVKNPWKPGQINLTEQARILKENPALAKQLMESRYK